VIVREIQKIQKYQDKLRLSEDINNKSWEQLIVSVSPFWLTRLGYLGSEKRKN
jgi:hypothetical protein